MPETNPYSPPRYVSPGSDFTRPQATKIAKAGAWLQLLAVLGILGTVFGMVRAFSKLGANRVADPSELSRAIGDVLLFTAAGFWGSLIGCVMLGIAIFIQRCRARWVHVIFWLSLLPALNGIFMLATMILRSSHADPQ